MKIFHILNKGNCFKAGNLGGNVGYKIRKKKATLRVSDSEAIRWMDILHGK